MKVFELDRIQAVLSIELATLRIREGFAALAAGAVQQPPVQHFDFPEQHGHLCVKSAHLLGQRHVVVKLSSGFYRNVDHGLDNNQGLMVALDAQTGQPTALLLDQGWLTTMRTALAGRIAAEYLAPQDPGAIGVLGSGAQARAQLLALESLTHCREGWVWSASVVRARALCEDLAAEGWRLRVAADPRQVAQQCRWIITCTPSTRPLIERGWVQPGTHITAVGADGIGKQELDPALVAAADVRVVDSAAQCLAFGECQHAYAQGMITRDSVVELGALVLGQHPGRTSAQQLTLVDLTGVAMQDAQIAGAVLDAIDGLS